MRPLRIGHGILKGWLAEMGAWDFAGGTVVHITAGCAALQVHWF